MNRAGLLPLVAILVALLPLPVSALTATGAADVCATNADPCTVTSVVDVAAGSTLDFGTRSVSVSGSGQFNFGIGSGIILCGGFTASTTNPAILAKGSLPGGGTSSGSVSVRARRRCSGGSMSRPCLDGEDCELGSCGTRRCSKRSTRTCTSDANCQLGTCGANRRCTGSAVIVRCATNADCDLGTCPAQLTCAGGGEEPVSCTTNGDCSFGTCSLGSGGIAMGGSILGNSDNPASVFLQAAGPVSITKTVNVSGTTSESDGGRLVVTAGDGSVLVAAKVNATGGSASQGGAVELSAGIDVTTGEEINVSGGGFDGGNLAIDAGRDVTIGRSVLANSVGGGGFGGEIQVDAGRDLRITGVSSLNRTTLETNASTDLTNSAGDGGVVDLLAGRAFVAGPNTRMSSRGSAPDGQGGEVYLYGSGAVSLAGVLIARADGGAGAGGLVDVGSGGILGATSDVSVDVGGGSGGGGTLTMASAADADVAGSVDAGGSNGGFGGSVLLDVDGDARLVGTWTIGGTTGGSIGVRACRIRLEAGAKLESKTSNGANTLVADESMRLLAGSSMIARSGGSNTLVYRTPTKPPLLQGTVSPAPAKIVDPTLAGCPVCGNAEVDIGETCDDGNTSNGDGCSASCQNEKCLTQTIAPGYPGVALCEDGDPCTADFCDPVQNGGTCLHPARTCEDGYDCTTDTCVGGVCLHVPVHSVCDDGNPCTDDFCSAQSGCGATANSAPCEDGNSCTVADQCVAAQCVGTMVPGCGFCGDGEVNPSEECDDGNSTFTAGEYCGAGCVSVPCGKPTNSTGALPKASDALFTLRSAVGQGTCSPRVCDVDRSGKVLSSDALRILRTAVGQAVVLNCPVD